MTPFFRVWFWQMKWHNARDDFNHWVARHLPRRLLYWCVIVASIRTLPDNMSPDEQRVVDIIKTMDRN